jgi:mono/diheme cytochrome c family protein
MRRPAARLLLSGLLVGAILAPARSSSAQSIILRAGDRERTIDLGALPRTALSLRDPSDGGRAKRLAGPRLADVLAQAPAPADADTLAVYCDDGWLSLVPLDWLARYPGAVLALAEGPGDGRPLAPPRGPVFLAFPSDGTPRDRAVDDNGYAWGVAIIVYVRRERLLAPLATAAPSEEVARGGSLYLGHCLHCHAIGGAGGMVGWDLSRPNVLSYRDAQRVRDYIVDPRRLLPEGRMPSFRGQLSPSEIDALIAYLRALGPLR